MSFAKALFYNFLNSILWDGSLVAKVPAMVGLTPPANYVAIFWYHGFEAIVQKTAMGFMSYGNTNYSGFSLQYNSGNYSYINIMAAPSVGNAQSQAISLLARNCAMLIRDSSQIAGQRYRFLHNGVDVSTGSNTITTYPATYESEFRLGDYFNTNKFRGPWREMRLIPQLISSADLIDYYNKGRGNVNLDALPHDLWFKFDGNGNDSSGNNRHITFTGTPSYIL